MKRSSNVEKHMFKKKARRLGERERGLEFMHFVQV